LNGVEVRCRTGCYEEGTMCRGEAEKKKGKQYQRKEPKGMNLRRKKRKPINIKKNILEQRISRTTSKL